MGYRSDIRIRLKKEDYERLVKSFEQDNKIISFGAENLFEHLDKYVEEKDHKYCEYDKNTDDYIEKTTDTIYFGWNSIKWYDDYEDVQFVMNFLTQDETMPFAFTRIGESVDGDFEFLYNIFDEIFVYSGFDDDSENTQWGE